VDEYLPLDADPFYITTSYHDATAEYIVKEKGQRAKIIEPQAKPHSNVVNC